MRDKRSLSAIITIILVVVIIAANLLSGGLLFNLASRAVSPVGIVLNEAGNNVFGFFRNFSNIGSLQKENNDLKDRLNQALNQISELEVAKKENEALKKDLGFKTSNNYNYIAATVISFDPSLRDGINLKVEDSSLIKVNQAVVSEGFLIGRVKKIEDNNIKVALITDSLSAIPAEIQNKKITGVLKGQIGNGLMLEQVPQTEDVKENDSVITSGLGGDLPRGIIVATVSKLQKVSGSIFQTIELRPMVELSHIERAMIIIQ